MDSEWRQARMKAIELAVSEENRLGWWKLADEITEYVMTGRKPAYATGRVQRGQ